MHNNQTKRVKRRCPLPGCEKRPPLVRLSNHIRQYHQINSGTERQKWLVKAKVSVSILLNICKPYVGYMCVVQALV